MFLLSVNVSHSVVVWLCNPMDYSPSGFSVHGILQARSWPMDWTQVSWIAGRFFTTEPPGKPIKEEKSLYLVLRVFYAVLCLIAQSCPTLQPHGLHPARFLCPWRFSRQGYWSGLRCPPQGIFPAEGLNPCLQHCRMTLYHLSHQGSPRILEWKAYPFSRGSSQPRNWTGISLQADSLPAELLGKERKETLIHKLLFIFHHTAFFYL